MISEQLSIDQPISGGSGRALKRALGLCCGEEEEEEEEEEVLRSQDLSSVKEVSGGSATPVPRLP